MKIMNIKKISRAMIVLIILYTSYPVANSQINFEGAVLTDGNILYVGGSGPGNYSTIQAAIDNASDGDIIYVYNGTYFENVYIDVRIQLLGENTNITIIDGNCTDSVVTIDADEVILSGFTIRNAGTIPTHEDHGVKVFSNYNVIQNNRIINNTLGGLQLRYSSYNSIFDNNISDNYCGINIFSSSYNIIENNTITDNYADGIGMGGVPTNCHKNIILNNDIYYNLCGIWLGFDCIDCSLIDNNIIGSSSGESVGIKTVSSYINISKNIIQNTLYGIDIGISFDSTHCLISNNLIKENEHGIYLYRTSFHTITQNHITNNNYGIVVDISSNNSIIKNNFIKNKRNAIFIQNVTNTWSENYWNRPKFLPKIIFGYDKFYIKFHIPDRFNFDMDPALIPYNI